MSSHPDNQSESPKPEPLCTVLLITYNHAPYLERSLDSVLNQKTPHPHEIHIFDDASTDGSPEIIRRYAQNHPGQIFAHLSPTNLGAQDNFWRAYQSVKTKYCCVMETDDYWCDDRKLDLQITAMEQHPDCACCHHQTYIEDATGKRTFVMSPASFGNRSVYTASDINYETLNRPYISHINSRLIRMAAVDLDNLPDKEDFLYDNNQYFYLLTRGPQIYLDRPMSVYSFTGTGVRSGRRPYAYLDRHLRTVLDFNRDSEYALGHMVCTHLVEYLYWTMSQEPLEPLLDARSPFRYDFADWRPAPLPELPLLDPEPPPEPAPEAGGEKPDQAETGWCMRRLCPPFLQPLILILKNRPAGQGIGAGVKQGIVDYTAECMHRAEAIRWEDWSGRQPEGRGWWRSAAAAILPPILAEPLGLGEKPGETGYFTRKYISLLRGGLVGSGRFATGVKLEDD